MSAKATRSTAAISTETATGTRLRLYPAATMATADSAMNSQIAVVNSVFLAP
jgi:hypothetical protein